VGVLSGFSLWQCKCRHEGSRIQMALLEIPVKKVPVKQLREVLIRDYDRMAIHGAAAFHTLEHIHVLLKVQTEISMELLAAIASHASSTVEIEWVEGL